MNNENQGILKVYREKVTDRMVIDDWNEYNEILFRFFLVLERRFIRTWNALWLWLALDEAHSLEIFKRSWKVPSQVSPVCNLLIVRFPLWNFPLHGRFTRVHTPVKKRYWENDEFLSVTHRFPKRNSSFSSLELNFQDGTQCETCET